MDSHQMQPHSARPPRWPLCLWLLHANSLKVKTPHSNHLSLLSICTEQVDFDDLPFHHHGVKRTRIEHDALSKAAKMAHVFMPHHVPSHANSLKVQTSSGNYLSFIICHFFSITFIFYYLIQS